MDAGAVGRATFQPGWQWSKHVKPIAGTDSCQAAHLGYFISGQMTVRMDDGEEADLRTRRFHEVPARPRCVDRRRRALRRHRLAGLRRLRERVSSHPRCHQWPLTITGLGRVPVAWCKRPARRSSRRGPERAPLDRARPGPRAPSAVSGGPAPRARRTPFLIVWTTRRTQEGGPFPTGLALTAVTTAIRGRRGRRGRCRRLQDRFSRVV